MALCASMVIALALWKHECQGADTAEHSMCRHEFRSQNWSTVAYRVLFKSSLVSPSLTLCADGTHLRDAMTA